MKRILYGLTAILCCMSTAMAQYPDASMLTPLPLNPKVKTGVLKNGLTYYIMHNEEPKERANFYIAQKVGSTLEEQDQLGLAHFLEHMAFNGTTHYPGKAMLNYLQSKGIRFGADINAYTSFDETIYNINNVPTTDKNLMDSVLLVLHDWSGEILLEESEIDAERGVIQEEWRSTQNASRRQMEEVLPQIYKEYQYQQLPIGKMDVIRNFKPEVLRAYYKKWYRPDQQGIVIVGDFDAAEMEQKVKELFSTIEMPKNAAKRNYPKVSDNNQPIYTTYADPELSNITIRIAFKSERTPFELRNTAEMYMNDVILNGIVSTMMNNRLSDAVLEPDCDFSRVGVGFSTFLVSKTKDAFNIVIIPKGKDAVAATQDAMAVIARAFKTGFTRSEYDRATQEILSSLQKQLSEKDKTNNNYFGNELCRYFVDNVPAPGIETEYQLWSMTLPNIPLEGINQLLRDEFYPTLVSGKNMVVMLSVPKAEGFEIASEETMLSTISDALKAEYEALEDEKIEEPLISQLPKPGTVTRIQSNNELGTFNITLSNGIKVILKETDFANDEVKMTAFRRGGKQLYSPEQAPNVLIADLAIESSKWGPFDSKTLPKYLAGKNVDIDFSINTYTDMLTGSSTVKDLPYLFELIYTAFTNINPDEETYNVNLGRIRPQYENIEKNPQFVFQNEVTKSRYDGNPLMMVLNLETLDKANYLESLDLVKGVLKNAAEYTFVFTGNITYDDLKPLLEQYIATLPVALRKKPVIKSELGLAKGQIENRFKQPMAIPSINVFDIYTGYNVPFNVKNNIMVGLMGDILDNIYTDTLREEEGGTYGAGVGADLNPNNGAWRLLYTFVTNEDQKDALINRAHEEYLKLLANGADEVNFTKAKEAMIKQYEINSRKNSYWDSMLVTQELFPDFNSLQEFDQTLRNLSLDEFNQFIKDIYDGQNRVQVIMEGYQAE
ncbi:MAG: insulinase family protein [Muribaculaceae bacterium]|nr:insulinase family protein [Muribaculaceae bacterium]